MLQISEQQYDALDGYSIDGWNSRLMGWLREHADRARELDDPALLSIIEQQQKFAAAYSVESERALAKWCFLALAAGERFFEEARVDALLRDSRFGLPEDRMDALLRSYRGEEHQH